MWAKEAILCDSGSFADAAVDQNGTVPTVHREMALLASGGKSLSLVIGICGFSECTQMTTHAFGRESEAIELADGTNLVTGIAVHGCVSADQRKAILMFIDIVNGNLPAIGIVTQLALCPVLPPVQVGVTVLALQWCVAENKILVAIGTLHLCVPAA